MSVASNPTSPCPPINDEDWPAEIADLRTGFAGALNVYRTMAHHPSLLRAWVPLRQHVVNCSALGAVRSELVILRAAHRMDSAYEWTHHVSRARGLGISEARIQAMRNLPAGEDALIARAVDELFDEKCLSLEIESALSSEMGTQAIFDLMTTVGFYSVLGFILKTYDTPIDEAVAQELSARPI
ncbi:carboxymuconolactone decarboxylase family protein [Mesorhizobium ciceri]|uniref:carboxymuconolactone decarboxylase family protein n=1 Tax=Mesorhizobium TaxID=68287 RepID=UPI0007A94A03|nr:carboxymuconolactone decarboxylase family protein [Mesorhizobium ciceri]AMX98923.1 carboxymuconolactone decarboxylase [Mesorhizobium ciceri biovar biserrulae]